LKVQGVPKPEERADWWGPRKTGKPTTNERGRRRDESNRASALEKECNGVQGGVGEGFKRNRDVCLHRGQFDETRKPNRGIGEEWPFSGKAELKGVGGIAGGTMNNCESGEKRRKKKQNDVGWEGGGLKSDKGTWGVWRRDTKRPRGKRNRKRRKQKRLQKKSIKKARRK